MKRSAIWLGLILAGLWGAQAQASIFDLWTASFTQTADTYVILSSSPAVLNEVCIDSAGVGAGAAVSIYNINRNAIAVSTVAIIDASSTGSKSCYLFNVFCSSGIAYTTGGTTAPKMTILWNPYHR